MDDRATSIMSHPEYAGDLEDLDREFPAPSFEGPQSEIQPAAIQDEMAAERHLKAMSYYEHEATWIRQHAAAHRARIDAWEQARIRPITGRLAWHEAGLKAFLTTSGKKAIKLAYGSMKWMKGRERVEILDQGAFETWVRGAEFDRARWDAFVRTKTTYEPIKAAIKAHIETTGEVPNGVDLVTGDETFKIDVA